MDGHMDIWRDIMPVLALSLGVSLAATLIATALALPVAALLAVRRFPGRTPVISILNALTGLPPVVVGLLVYVSLSRAGPLGQFGILFTPAAMVIAQSLLVFPVICAVGRQIIADCHEEYRDFFQTLDLSLGRTIVTLLVDARLSLVTAVVTGFGRAVAEVGSVLIVGGNIKGLTRVMTTAITLETSKGNITLALALGATLVAVVVLLNSVVAIIQSHAGRS